MALPKAWQTGKGKSKSLPIPVIHCWPCQDESGPVCQFANLLVSIKDDTVSGFLLLEGWTFVSSSGYISLGEPMNCLHLCHQD